MTDPILQQLAKIDSVEAAETAILTLASEILKAPNNQRRKNLGEIRKLLQHTIKDNLLPAKEHDQRLDGLDSAWLEILEIVKPHVPITTWEQVEEKLKWVFGKSRLREGLSK